MNGTRLKNEIRRFFKRLLTAPLALCSVLDEADTQLLLSAVDKRTARAEAAVLRDFFAQHGLEGDQLAEAQEEYRALRRKQQPDPALLEELRLRAEQAEKAAAHSAVSAEVRVQMARLGIPERHSADVLLLAARELEQAENDGGDPGEVRRALEAVVARLPGLAEPEGKPAGISAGSPGNFPRLNDAALSYQQSLERARAAGDNAAAVSIITSAAEKGISLR